jgi:hypothetical protein
LFKRWAPPTKTRILLFPLIRAPAWRCSLCKIQSYNGILWKRIWSWNWFFLSVRNYFLTQEITASPCALKDPNSYIFCPCWCFFVDWTLLLINVDALSFRPSVYTSTSFELNAIYVRTSRLLWWTRKSCFHSLSLSLSFCVCASSLLHKRICWCWIWWFSQVTWAWDGLIDPPFSCPTHHQLAK